MKREGTVRASTTLSYIFYLLLLKLLSASHNK